MIREESDIDPEDPDHYEQVFLPSDRKEWSHKNPQHVKEHREAEEAFEARRQTRIFMNQNTEKRLPFGILKEVHVADCTCSYCGRNGYDKGMKLGFNIPPHWNSTISWYVWRKAGPNNTSIYYRATFSCLWRALMRRRSNQAA